MLSRRHLGTHPRGCTCRARLCRAPRRSLGRKPPGERRKRWASLVQAGVARLGLSAYGWPWGASRGESRRDPRGPRRDLPRCAPYACDGSARVRPCRSMRIKKKKTHGGRRAVMRRTRPSCRPAAGLCRRLGDVGKNVGRPARDRARGTPTHKERNSRSAPGRRAPEGLRFCGPPVGLGEAALSTLLLPLLSGRRDRCVRHGPRRPPEPVRMRGWAHRVRSSSPWALPEEKKTCARPRSVCDGPCAWCVRLS